MFSGSGCTKLLFEKERPQTEESKQPQPPFLFFSSKLSTSGTKFRETWGNSIQLHFLYCSNILICLHQRSSPEISKADTYVTTCTHTSPTVTPSLKIEIKKLHVKAGTESLDFDTKTINVRDNKQVRDNNRHHLKLKFTALSITAHSLFFLLTLISTSLAPTFNPGWLNLLFRIDTKYFIQPCRHFVLYCILAQGL